MNILGLSLSGFSKMAILKTRKISVVIHCAGVKLNQTKNGHFLTPKQTFLDSGRISLLGLFFLLSFFFRRTVSREKGKKKPRFESKRTRQKNESVADFSSKI